MHQSDRRYYYLALGLGLALHGTSLMFTFEGTYDAYVHMFFAEHYADAWFSSWNTKWYTGFTVTSYPPLVHQIIALCSYLIGLKGGFLFWSMMITLVFIRGVYQFSKLWVDAKSAAFAALVAVFSTSFGEALHIFGQLPSITGLAFLLNACPEIYQWLRNDNHWKLASGLALLAVTTSAHHVTTIFGMVFFILPVLGLAVIDRCAEKHRGEVHFRQFVEEVIKVLPRLVGFGLAVITLTLMVIFPYWYWSKSDPISQVPIPHGSRDSYIEVLSSGLVFFLIPWGLMLLALPYLFTKFFRKRNMFAGLSFVLLFLLGTGGTTPLPKLMLGDTAFEILTLDRFTFWATILALPFWGMFMREILVGNFKEKLIGKIGKPLALVARAAVVFILVTSTGLVINFQNFVKTQPDEIDIDPIVRFLDQDLHYRWRYLTLGFGDQMAWLAANTDATTVDGNYHSVRRLPEMTSRAVERLENAKYLGMDGLRSLQDFLTNPERYNLKYIFSNDRFYDPLLFFSGWDKIRQLENHIVVWERQDIPPVPQILPSNTIPAYQRLMWGILPVSALFLAGIILVLLKIKSPQKFFMARGSNNKNFPEQKDPWRIHAFWFVSVVLLAGILTTVLLYRNGNQQTPENVIKAYFQALDYKEFKKVYTYFDPETRPPFEQYMKESFIEGGILSSYAKLDTLEIVKMTGAKADVAEMEVRATWLTALQPYHTTHRFTTIKSGSSWYLKPLQIQAQMPQDRFIQMPQIAFYKQGRRNASILETLKQDVMDRPDIAVLSANLICRDSAYSIVGELMNLDNVPAFIAIEGIVYNAYDEIMARNQAMDVMVHHLYAKEKTPFRIDFPAVAGMINEMEIDPADFVVFARSTVVDIAGYRQIGVGDVTVSPQGNIFGKCINYGPQHIIVPQLLVSHFCNDEDIIWVEPVYMSEGIRPQRYGRFQIRPSGLHNIDVILTGKPAHLLGNGISRIDFARRGLLPSNWHAIDSQKFKFQGVDLRMDIKPNSMTANLYDDE